VSRATAYRYFPTQDALLNEVMYLTPSLEFIDKAIEQLESDDPEVRLLWLLDLFNPIVLREEASYRALARLYIETWFASANDDAPERPRVREGRRTRWLAGVLAPLKDRLSPAALERLQYSLALTLGIDSVIILKDACGIEDDQEILDVLRSTAVSILRAALTEASSASVTTEKAPGPAD
jgi:AcrR family transcriptional regulator